MSKTQNLNSGGLPYDPEWLLNNLAPQPPDINRDDLFFRAGFAAGAQSRHASLLWPSAVAALLLICIGLSAAVVNQNAGRFNSALSHVESSPQIATNPQAENISVTPPADEDRQTRNWQRLASPAPLPSGKLTAMGWTEAPAELGNDEGEIGPQRGGLHPEQLKSSKPRRPDTYFELLRTYLES